MYFLELLPLILIMLNLDHLRTYPLSLTLTLTQNLKL